MEQGSLVLVDLLDRELGGIKEEQAYEKESIHRSFSVYLFKGGRMLLRRLPYPDKSGAERWSNGCNGCPGAGEQVELAAAKGLERELGISRQVKIREAFTFLCCNREKNGSAGWELNHVLIAEYKGASRKLPSLADRSGWIEFKTLGRDVAENPDNYTPAFAACAPRVLDMIQNRQVFPPEAMQPAEQLAWRYPQLTLAPQSGLSKQAAYKDIVEWGYLPEEAASPFRENPAIIFVQTPIGLEEVVLFSCREDFVYFVQVMCCRCEPVPLEASTCAAWAEGVNNWRRIHQHKQQYMQAETNPDWPEEFKNFTMNGENYKERLLAVAVGGIGGLKGSEVGMAEGRWKEVSLLLRMFRELTYFAASRLFPERRNREWLGPMADCIGLLYATGGYDTELAKKLLTVQEGVVDGKAQPARQTGRAENRGAYIERWEAGWNRMGRPEPFDFLLAMGAEQSEKTAGKGWGSD